MFIRSSFFCLILDYTARLKLAWIGDCCHRILNCSSCFTQSWIIKVMKTTTVFFGRNKFPLQNRFHEWTNDDEANIDSNFFAWNDKRTKIHVVNHICSRRFFLLLCVGILAWNIQRTFCRARIKDFCKKKFKAFLTFCLFCQNFSDSKLFCLNAFIWNYVKEFQSHHKRVYLKLCE